ncbi:AMP-binding protein [Nocardia jinanensis]|uniref:Fatty-acyl-CoA synthase n=1 Tax=Nocardia jinanensis TaxID=382504 RepID=A0A917RUI0_9NOCA|nr:AMP-binding protein [Nocardia jinanensis]GGL31418.1 fatty-acyl-CoA synthase [Nocardia jinanensis]
MTIDGFRSRAGLLAEELKAYARLQQTGVLDLTRPRGVLRLAGNTRRYGAQASLIKKTARELPEGTAVIDERGPLTYRQLDEQSDALANALLACGLAPGAVVAVLARDHRGLLLTISAAGRAGLRLTMLNTGFGAAQLVEVIQREQAQVVLHDAEFAGRLEGLPADLPRFLTWTEPDHLAGRPETIDELIAAADTTPPEAPRQPGGFVILTSGTTGTPKGAPRTTVTPLLSAMLVDRIPFPRRGTILIAAPLFHAYPFGMWTVGVALGNRVVLARRFDAEATVRALAEHRAELLVGVPTMLHRILDLGPEIIGRYDLSALRAIVVAGSTLTPHLAQRAQDTFGEVLYNLYGSTEVAVATVAQPAELRRAPGTAGRAPVMVHAVLYDNDDRLIDTPNTKGRIFVRTGAPFEGYTDGGHKQIIDGHMSTGDIGHFDEEGLLFVDGRDDDMIVSGGENVYPLEVEHLLADHPGVADVAVVGVDDPEFGKRLRAVIVAAPGAALEPQAVRDHVKANLARHKVPRDVLFVEVLPRNATGKVVRRALQELDAVPDRA